MIADQIQDMVQTGKLKPFDKLPSERELCEQFSASRTAIREAVSGLISKGILERRNRGIYVRPFDTNGMMQSMSLLIAAKQISIKDILEARTILEIENAGLAAERATEEDLEKLHQCVQDLENPSASEALIRQRASEFHQQIAKSTHNPLLEDFFMVMFEIFMNDPRSISTVSKSASSHRNVYEKVKARDPSEARKEMSRHLEIVKMSY